jgi:fluoride exporter
MANRPPPPASRIAAVAAGGAVGGTLRYAFILAFPVVPGAIPWVIFWENVIGAFALGLIVVLVLERWRPPWDVRSFLTVGLLGSFTTFSNYTLDVVTLASEGAVALALAYGGGSALAGLAAAVLGMRLGRTVAGGPPAGGAR